MLSINLGRSVLEKNCALGLEYLKTKGTKSDKMFLEKSARHD